VALTALREHLPGADYVVASIPLTSDTELLLNRETLALLPPRAILVNMARSRVVDEVALFDALANGRLRAAAIDVWTRRPGSVEERLDPSELPFADLENVLITPHLAGWSTATQTNRWTEIAANIDRLAQGIEPVDIAARGAR
jgi:phosphoglycerate dehydrogenase-like enzyme